MASERNTTIDELVQSRVSSVVRRLHAKGVARLKTLVGQDEQVIDLANCMKGWTAGLLAVTDQRIIFVTTKGEPEQVRHADLGPVEVTGFGTTLVLEVAGGRASFGALPKGRAADLADRLPRLREGASTETVTGAEVVPPLRPAVQSGIPWHKRPIVVIIALVFVAPLGIGLAWWHKLWSQRTRIIASVASAAFMIFAVVGSQLEKKEEQDAKQAALPAAPTMPSVAEPRPGPVPATTVAISTPAESSQARLLAMLKSAREKHGAAPDEKAKNVVLKEAATAIKDFLASSGGRVLEWHGFVNEASSSGQTIRITVGETTNDPRWKVATPDVTFEAGFGLSDFIDKAVVAGIGQLPAAGDCLVFSGKVLETSSVLKPKFRIEYTALKSCSEDQCRKAAVGPAAEESGSPSVVQVVRAAGQCSRRRLHAEPKLSADALELEVEVRDIADAVEHLKFWAKTVFGADKSLGSLTLRVRQITSRPLTLQVKRTDYDAMLATWNSATAKDLGKVVRAENAPIDDGDFDPNPDASFLEDWRAATDTFPSEKEKAAYLKRKGKEAEKERWEICTEVEVKNFSGGNVVLEYNYGMVRDWPSASNGAFEKLKECAEGFEKIPELKSIKTILYVALIDEGTGGEKRVKAAEYTLSRTRAAGIENWDKVFAVDMDKVVDRLSRTDRRIFR